LFIWLFFVIAPGVALVLLGYAIRREKCIDEEVSFS